MGGNKLVKAVWELARQGRTVVVQSKDEENPVAMWDALRLTGCWKP